ncbi:MFS transporter [Pseudonocardia spinosispora]|uniref:MFS transporter n=1 Tax=Pseudonocardia spinosispora TaxID=103441 RepID=UPI0003FC207B|nr:MFS transporter [Pseudonocardia spinosispora]
MSGPAERGRTRLPPVLRNRDFDLYWGGVVLSQVGTRAAVAANLYQVYELSHSTLQVGFVGIAQAVALVVLSPLGGVVADRMDRRRLLQYTQAAALVVAAVLAAVTLSGRATTWMVVLSSLLATAAATFDQPARQALIPALVPRHQMVDAIALINPSRELAVLTGPALAGVLIAAAGPGAVYLFDAVTYAVLVGTLAAVRVTTPRPAGRAEPVLRALAEGAAQFRRRPVVWQMMGLDLAATVFSSYRVLLPAFALDVLHAGPTGYGLLSAAPSAGALVGSVLVFRLVRSRRSGVLVLVSTAAYGFVVLAFAEATVLWLALALAGLLGVADAVATTVRQAAVQVETPDELRGRVSAIYQMASRGGPAIGDGLVGAVAGALGPVEALTIGGLVPIVAAGATALGGRTVRGYSIAASGPAPT